jgi:PTH1 family peptidyl-tRNA hydrolase
MIIVVGLGNPGTRYEGTRHNVGFEVADRLAARHGISVRERAHHALIGQGTIGGCRVLLAKPMTYMNLSGEAVGSLSRYFRVEPADVWVIVDDVALPVGSLRLRLKGSSGGHHGLESIEAHLGSRGFPRIRIGIGGSDRGDLVSHVLARFTVVEREKMAVVIERAADAVETALAEGFEAAMNRFNRSPAPEELPQGDE